MTASVNDQLDQLREELGASRRRPSEIRAEFNELGRTVQLQKERLADLFARTERGEEVDREADDARKALAAAEKKLAAERWEERILGAEQNARQLESDLHAFVLENIDALVSEHEAPAIAAHDRIHAALDELRAALADESRIGSSVTQLLNVARGDHRLPPLENPLYAVMSEINRAAERMTLAVAREPMMLRDQTPAQEVAA